MPRYIDERRLAFFGALCLFLSSLEFLIPKPLPFLRIGLANLPILLCLTPPAERNQNIFPVRFILALVGLKIAGQALLGGTLFSYIFVFSAAGSFTSAAVMLAANRLFGNKLSLIGLSVLGSLGSNAAQILFARCYLLGEGAWLIAPFFFMLGTASGFLLGVFALALRENIGRGPWIVYPADESSAANSAEQQQPAFDTMAFFSAVCGLISVLPFVFSASFKAKLILAVFYMALCFSCGKRIRLLPNIILFLTVTALHCFQPFGKVLFTIGDFPFTEGAIHTGLFRSATLIGLVYLSRLCVRPSIAFPGKAGRVLSAALRDFERLTAGSRPALSNFWVSLDTILAAVWLAPQNAGNVTADTRFRLRQAVPGLLIVFFTWAAYIYWG